MLNIEKIISSGKTVFSISDLQVILGLDNKYSIRNYLSQSSKKGILKNLYYGVWGFANFDIHELAVKIKSNSYISLETVLQKEAIVFQDYSNSIFLVSDRSDTKKVLGYNLEIRKIKKSILSNPLGVIHKGNYSIASKERAICDRLYLSGEYYFDNLMKLDISLLKSLIEIYPTKTKKLILNIIINAESR